LQKADTLSVQLPFKKIRKESNPVKFDKKAYYQSKGIFHEGFINDKLELEYKGFYSSTNHPIASTRNRIAKKIQNLKLKKKSKAFMHALILGNKSHMHSSTLESFADTGCIHVLAVSGLHTGIIFSLFSPFLYFLRFKHDLRWLTLAMVIGLLYIFVSICGYPPSAVRASCMLSLWLLIKCLGISHNAFSILALTAFVVLMIQPVQIDQLGFKLSYLALTGIIVLYNKIPFRDNPHIQSIWASPFRMIWLSICAQYFLSPLLLLEMNSFAPYFAVSSMIAVPFIYIIMLLSIIVIISHRFIPLLNNILDTLISSLTNTIAFIEKWPLSTINEVYFTELAFGISFIFLTLLSIGLAYQNKVILVFALSILFSIIPCLQAQRLHQLHTVDISIFHKTLGSLVTVHHHGLEHVVFQSGRNNKDYLLSKQRIKHSIHSKSHNPIQPPVIIQSENLSLMIADSENEVCSISCIPAYLDFLLLTKANRNKLYKLMACIDIKMVIIDGSTTYDNKNQIIELLDNLGIQYHDTSTKGYWNYKFLNI